MSQVEITNQTVTITLDVKYLGDMKVFMAILKRLADDPRAVDVSGAIPSALWRVLNTELSNEGNLRVSHPDPKIRRYAVDLTFTLSTKYSEGVWAGLLAWNDEPHGQDNDEALNLALTAAIWNNHIYSEVNCVLRSQVTHVLFSKDYAGTGAQQRFTVKVSFLVEARGNDKAEAIDYNEIYRALGTYSRNIGSYPAIENALLEVLDSTVGTVAQVELIKIEEA